MEITEKHLRKIGGYLTDYRDNNAWSYELSPTYIEDLVYIRSQMRPKMALEAVPYLNYKKTLWEMMKSDYNIVGFEFSDDSLLSNRLPDGEKLTKRILKELSKNRGYQVHESRLDYFHKLRNEDNKYIISSDPYDILRLYNSGESPITCLSAGGENQSTMYRYLFSDQVYIAYTSDEKTRLVIFDNPEEKVVFLNPNYGARDYMLRQVVIQHYINLGYRFVKYADEFFDFYGWFYIDTNTFQDFSLVEIMGGEVLENWNKERVKLNRIPDHWIKPYEALTGSPVLDGIIWPWFKDSNSTTVELEQECCPDCGEVVWQDDFEEDFDMCYECASNYRSYEGSYCVRCDNWHHHDDIDEDGYCDYCATQIRQYVCDACGETIFEEKFDSEGYICADCDREGRALEAIKILEERINENS